MDQDKLNGIPNEQPSGDGNEAAQPKEKPRASGPKRPVQTVLMTEEGKAKPSPEGQSAATKEPAAQEPESVAATDQPTADTAETASKTKRPDGAPKKKKKRPEGTESASGDAAPKAERPDGAPKKKKKRPEGTESVSGDAAPKAERPDGAPKKKKKRPEGTVSAEAPVVSSAKASDAPKVTTPTESPLVSSAKAPEAPKVATPAEAPVMAPAKAPDAPKVTTPTESPVVSPAKAPEAPKVTASAEAPVMASAKAPDAPKATTPAAGLVMAPVKAPEAPKATTPAEAPVVSPAKAPEAPKVTTPAESPVVSPAKASDAPKATTPAAGLVMASAKAPDAPKAATPAEAPKADKPGKRKKSKKAPQPPQTKAQTAGAGHPAQTVGKAAAEDEAKETAGGGVALMVEDEELPPSATPEAKARRRTMIFGTVFILFAVVGVVSVVVWLAGTMIDLFKKPDENQTLVAYLQPMVMFDPAPFETLEEADQMMIRQSAICAALYTYGKSGKYSFDAMDQLILPTTDVDAACASLYGAEQVFSHMTFGDFENTYMYDSEIACYLVPVSGMSAYYKPQIDEIQREDNILTVTVGYLPRANFWEADPTGDAYSPTPDKQMIYVLEETEKGYKVLAVRDLNDNLPPGHAVSTGVSQTNS